MVTLHWERLAAGSWRLVGDDLSVWATVERLIDERTGKPAEGGGRGMFARPRFKAICTNDEMPSNAGGEPHRYWVLGSTVGKAKRHVESWLFRNAGAVENFTITDEAPEPVFIPTLAGLQALGIASC
jgi:hypothetical protein